MIERSLNLHLAREVCKASVFREACAIDLQLDDVVVRDEEIVRLRLTRNGIVNLCSIPIDIKIVLDDAGLEKARNVGVRVEN